jgi:hypothetical protein
MKFFMTSFAKSAVTWIHIEACHFIFTQPSFACLALVLKHVGQLKYKILNELNLLFIVKFFITLEQMAIRPFCELMNYKMADCLQHKYIRYAA